MLRHTFFQNDVFTLLSKYPKLVPFEIHIMDLSCCSNNEYSHLNIFLNLRKVYMYLSSTVDPVFMLMLMFMFDSSFCTEKHAFGSQDKLNLP